MSNSNKALLSDAEWVRVDLCDLIAEYRGVGCKTLVALERATKWCGVKARRLFTIFFQNQSYAVTPAQRRSLRLGIANAFDEIADKAFERGARCRLRAELIRLSEEKAEQLELALGGNDECPSERSEKSGSAAVVFGIASLVQLAV